MKAKDWHGFAYYAMYTPRQRRILVKLDRGIIRLWHFALWFVPLCLVIDVLRSS